MKVIYINGSSRKGGHTSSIAQILCAPQKNNVIHLSDYNIGFFEYDHSNAHDDFLPLINELIESDIWVYLTPVYWYSMSARMKTFFDRLSDLLKWEHDLRGKIKSSRWYALSCGSDDDEVPGFFESFRRSAEYLEVPYMGNVHVWKDKRKPLDERVISRLMTFKEAIAQGKSV
jgi:multimeric flavodoxin WrbA